MCCDSDSLEADASALAPLLLLFFVLSVAVMCFSRALSGCQVLAACCGDAQPVRAASLLAPTLFAWLTMMLLS